MQIKLDELIRATEAAGNALLDLEELDERAPNRVRNSHELLARQARNESDAALHVDTDRSS